jgi:1D-myo-inositol-tetrakisphosphate 5-kinase/inositol-polyphosphate multikinase
LPRNTLVPILRTLREEIALIRDTYSTLELWMVGGSLLVIYEADWACVEEGIEKYSEGDTEMEEVGDGVKDDVKGVEGHDEEDEDDDESMMTKNPGRHSS